MSPDSPAGSDLRGRASARDRHEALVSGVGCGYGPNVGAVGDGGREERNDVVFRGGLEADVVAKEQATRIPRCEVRDWRPIVVKRAVQMLLRLPAGAAVVGVAKPDVGGRDPV